MHSYRYQRSFRKLVAWQEAQKLFVEVYNATKLFERPGHYWLVDQLRRAASSVGAQIAEGSCMQTSAHQRSFYVRAHGSAVEVDHFLESAYAISLLPNELYDQLLNQASRTCFLTRRLSNSCTPIHK